MIRAEHITKSFDGRVVLDDISIEFLTGKTNLIIGRSGSGKTVLLKKAVVTNAGQEATAEVTWSTNKKANGSNLRLAAAKTTKAGKVILRTTGKAKRLYVKLVLSAPAVPGYQAYEFTKKWTVKR